MTAAILLVESDPDMAALICDMLARANYAVDGPYATLSDGMEALARSMPAAAILDVRLQRGDIDLLANDLARIIHRVVDRASGFRFLVGGRRGASLPGMSRRSGMLRLAG